MSHPTDQLIAILAQDVVPVRRLGSPARRAGLWLALVVALGAAVILAFADLHIFMVRTRSMALDIELAGSLTTGCLGVLAAFYLSLPDRPLAWALLPLPSLGLWLVGSGTSCYRQWLVDRDGAWALGESGHCFLFILAVGLPLGALLVLALRRARPIAPLRVAVTGGLGAAALAAFLLQFFHPFDVTLMDLTVHALAVAVIVTLFAWRRAWALRPA